MRYYDQYLPALYVDDSLEHSGILGMKWGIRRYQNEDGSLTPAGKERYSKAIDAQDSKYYSKREKRSGNRYLTKLSKKGIHGDDLTWQQYRASKNHGYNVSEKKDPAKGKKKKLDIKKLTDQFENITSEDGNTEAEKLFNDIQDKYGDTYWSAKDSENKYASKNFKKIDKEYQAARKKKLDPLEKKYRDLEAKKYIADENYYVEHPYEDMNSSEYANEYFKKKNNDPKLKKLDADTKKAYKKYSEAQVKLDNEFLDKHAGAALSELGYEDTKEGRELIRKYVMYD